MRLFAPLLSAALSATLLVGCAHALGESIDADATTTYVIVRHAEKGNDDPRDPTLTAEGLARANRLADSLRDAPLAAVYATAYRRTQQTALPSAQAHRLAVTTYDARQPAAEFAAELRKSHPHGTVLLVGHSNTAPAIAAALCQCDVAPMADDEFDRRMTVRIDSAGNATYDWTRQP
ncbi:phosphoglycerate mutase family protein [Lysobacter tyrosinilyticus]